MFRLRSEVVDCNVATRGYSMKIFISHMNCNVFKYSFFHCKASIWNFLHNNVINEPTSRLFNERIVIRYL